MSLVNVVNMIVLDNPTCFMNPFQFEITFECLQELEDGTTSSFHGDDRFEAETAFLTRAYSVFRGPFFLHLTEEILDLEWKVLYVGSAHDSHQDQVLDEILVGPVPVGLNKFVLQADPPDPSRLPPDEVLGVTVVLVTCSYRDKEFVRVGFYVNNEYLHPDYVAPPPASSAMPMSGVGDGGQATEAHLNAGSTDPNAVSADPNTGSAAADATSGTISDKPLPVYPNLDMSLVQRHILADKPRITKFPISWGAETEDSTSFKMATNASAGIFDANYETSMAVAGSSNSLSASSPASPMNTSMDVLMEG